MKPHVSSWFDHHHISVLFTILFCSLFPIVLHIDGSTTQSLLIVYYSSTSILMIYIVLASIGFHCIINIMKWLSIILLIFHTIQSVKRRTKKNNTIRTPPTKHTSNNTKRKLKKNKITTPITKNKHN